MPQNAASDDHSPDSGAPSRLPSKIGLALGPLLAASILLISAPESLRPEEGGLSPAWVTLALMVLMAVWWITEAIPIPVTSLLPLVVLPLAGVRAIDQAAAPYYHPVVVLLMGGFIFAKAIERWGLHERIALSILVRAGDNPRALIAGFMFAAALLSMWISNTATTIMMAPIALSVSDALARDKAGGSEAFAAALLLGIAYACSIGGLGTPIGTPTNLIVLSQLDALSGRQVDFASWVQFGVPVVALLIPIAWFILTYWVFPMPKRAGPGAVTVIKNRLAALGAITSPEWRTIGVFVLIGALWAFGQPLSELEMTIGGRAVTPFAGLTDHVTAIIAVLLCFLIPAGGGHAKGKRLLDWRTAEEIPWGVLLLFGGGLSLAAAITSTGLGSYIGERLGAVSALPAPLVLFFIIASVLALTEVTSNVATASALMPILGSLALSIGYPVETIAAAVALATSCAFMLPMATGPNAVVFATGKVSIRAMATAGLRLNVAAAAVIFVVAYWLAPVVLG